MSRFGRISLAGLPNAGKSSLMNAMLGSHLSLVSPKAQATRLPVSGLLSDSDTQMVFVDLPGSGEGPRRDTAGIERASLGRRVVDGRGNLKARLAPVGACVGAIAPLIAGAATRRRTA